MTNYPVAEPGACKVSIYRQAHCYGWPIATAGVGEVTVTAAMGDTGWTESKLKEVTATTGECYYALFKRKKCAAGSPGGVYKVTDEWLELDPDGKYLDMSPGCGSLVEFWIDKGQHALHGFELGYARDITYTKPDGTEVTALKYVAGWNCHQSGMQWSAADVAEATVFGDKNKCYYALFAGEVCKSAGAVYRISSNWYEKHYGGKFENKGSPKGCGTIVEKWLKKGAHSRYGTNLGAVGDPILGPDGLIAAYYVAPFACAKAGTGSVAAAMSFVISGRNCFTDLFEGSKAIGEPVDRVIAGGNVYGVKTDPNPCVPFPVKTYSATIRVVRGNFYRKRTYGQKDHGTQCTCPDGQKYWVQAETFQGCDRVACIDGDFDPSDCHRFIVVICSVIRLVLYICVCARQPQTEIVLGQKVSNRIFLDCKGFLLANVALLRTRFLAWLYLVQELYLRNRRTTDRAHSATSSYPSTGGTPTSTPVASGSRYASTTIRITVTAQHISAKSLGTTVASERTICLGCIWTGESGPTRGVPAGARSTRIYCRVALAATTGIAIGIADTVAATCTLWR